MSRSFAEWDDASAGTRHSGLPLFTIERIGDAPPRAAAGRRPPALRHPRARPHARDRGAGLRPHPRGARRRRAAGDRATSSQRWSRWSSTTAAASSRPRSTCATPTAARRWPASCSDADVFVQGYRPGAIAAHGFGPQEAARIRPGIVYVSLCAYGHAGPWAQRRGFDSLVQNANGLNIAEAEAAGADKPKPLPAQALDHGTGYLMAFAAMTALARRAPRGRKLARARLAGADRPLAAVTRAHRWPRLPRSRPRRRARPPRGQRLRLRPAHGGAARCGHGRDAAALGAPVGAARHPSAGLARLIFSLSMILSETVPIFDHAWLASGTRPVPPPAPCAGLSRPGRASARTGTPARTSPPGPARCRRRSRRRYGS